jgi:hypothetical protein
MSVDEQRPVASSQYELPARYGSRFFIQCVPDSKVPESGIV